MGIGPSDLGRKEGEEGAGALVTFRANNIFSKKREEKYFYLCVKMEAAAGLAGGQESRGQGFVSLITA